MRADTWGACGSKRCWNRCDRGAGSARSEHRWLPRPPHWRTLREAVRGAVQGYGGVHWHWWGWWRGGHVTGRWRHGGESWTGWARWWSIGSGSSTLDVVQFMAEVSHQLSAEPHIYSRDGSQATGNFIGSMSKSSSKAVGVHCRVQWQPTLTAELVKMTNGQFQNIGFLQFCDVLALRLESTDHQLLEFVEAAIDASASLALEHRLHHFAILISTRDGLRTVIRKRIREIVGHCICFVWVWVCVSVERWTRNAVLRPSGGLYRERRARDRGNAQSRRVPTRATCAEQLPPGRGGTRAAPRVRAVNNRRRGRTPRRLAPVIVALAHCCHG